MDMKVKTKQQNGAELVVRSLEAHGVSPAPTASRQNMR
jgi:hypothetical protein